MAGPIARRPAGLLDLLLTQQQGSNPRELGDALLPVIDLANFYGQERVTVSQLSPTFTVPAGNVSISIPSGESWRVISLATHGAFAAVGQRLAVGCIIGGLPGGSVAIGPAFELLDKTSVAATDNFSGSVLLDQTVYPSGTRFRFVCNAITLAGQPSIIPVVNVCYVRMET